MDSGVAARYLHGALDMPWKEVIAIKDRIAIYVHLRQLAAVPYPLDAPYVLSSEPVQPGSDCGEDSDSPDSHMANAPMK